VLAFPFFLVLFLFHLVRLTNDLENKPSPQKNRELSVIN
jgi:hypothetical protein